MNVVRQRYVVPRLFRALANRLKVFGSPLVQAEVHRHFRFSWIRIVVEPAYVFDVCLDSGRTQARNHVRGIRPRETRGLWISLSLPVARIREQVFL